MYIVIQFTTGDIRQLEAYFILVCTYVVRVKVKVVENGVL